MKLAILSTGMGAAFALASAACAAEPTIVLTPASAAPAVPLESRCAVGPAQGGDAEVECVVRQRTAANVAPIPAMRIVIRTQAESGHCRSQDAREIAMPGANAAPARAGALPQVIQDRRERVCAF